MINVRAFAVLLSSLAAFAFLSPEPAIRRVGNEIVVVGAASPAQSVKKATEDVVHTAAEHARRTGESVRHVGSAAYEKLAGAGESVHNAAQHSKDKASDSTARVKGAVLHTSDKAYDKLGDAAYATGDVAYEAGDWLKSGKHEEQGKLQRATEVLKERLHEEQQEPGKLQRATEMLKERLHEAMQYQPNLGEGVGYYTDGYGIASSGKDEAAERVEGYVDDAKNAAKHGYGYVNQEAEHGIGRGKEALHHGKEAVDHGKDEATSALEDAVNTAREYLNQAAEHTMNRGKDTLHQSREAVSHGKDEVASTAQGYVGDAKGAAREGYEYVNQEAEHTVHRGRDVLHQGAEAVKNAKDKVASTVQGYVDEATGAVKHGAEHISQEAHHTVNRGKDALQHSKDAVVDESKKGMDRTYKNLHELGSNAKGKMNETLRQAGRWAHDKLVKLNETEELALAVCKQWIQKSVTSVVRLLHLFVFSSVYGSALWVTFISGFALARSITKHQFGVVQSKIFPVYFRVLGSGILVLLATHTILHPFPSAGVSEMLQYYNLGGCLAFALLNTFLLEPQATKAMFEKLRLEKEEGRGVDAGHVPVMNEHSRAHMELANRKLNKLHTLSSAANLLVLVGLTWHLWYLNCRLVI